MPSNVTSLSSWISAIGLVLFSIISYFFIGLRPESVSFFISLSYVWIVFVGAVLFFYGCSDRISVFLLVSVCIFSLLCLIINGLSNSAALSFSYLKKWIMFSSSIIWIEFCKTRRVNRFYYRICVVLMLLVSIYAIMMHQNGFGIEDDGVFLLFGFPNTNETGMFLSIITMYLILIVTRSFVEKKRVFISLSVLVAVLFMSYLVYLTGCRSAMLSILFLVCVMTLDRLVKSTKVNKSFAFLWTIFPIVFVFVYLYLVMHLNLNWDFSFGYSDYGKNNLTRIEVWESVLGRIKDHPIFGDYYGASNGTGSFQCLNVHLDVILSYGVLVYLLFLFFIYRSVSSFCFRDSTFFQRCSLYAYMACFIMGTFEAALVSGSAGFFIPALGFLLLTKTE